MLKKIHYGNRLNDFILYFMEKNFDNSYPFKEQMILSIYQNPEDGKIQSEDVEQLKKEQNMIIYEQYVQDVNDSRLQSDKAIQTLLWIISGHKTNHETDYETAHKNFETLRILSKIILNELVPKYYDMLLLEDINFLPEPDKTLTSEKGKFFFGNVSNKKWLMKEYVQNVLNENKLPDSQMLIQISAMPYEKRKVATKIYFSQKEMNSFKSLEGIHFSFDSEIPNKVEIEPGSLRAVRKLMEMSGNGCGLWVRTSDFLIEGIVDDAQDIICDTCITFRDQLVWHINKDKEKILEYCKGKYYIPALEAENDNDKQIKKIDDLHDNVSAEKIQAMKELLKRIHSLCQHGTSIVFMDRTFIKTEIDDRLEQYKKAYRMVPFSMPCISDNLLKGITSIDGAIFSDLDCLCHAAGVIVDGITKAAGDPGRGARHHSLENYIKGFKENHPDALCFTAIFSEDDTIKIVFP